MGLLDFSLNDVGGVFTSIREAITGKKIEDPQKLLEEVNKLQVQYLKAQEKIISTEAGSEHWITSAWRPITMLTFVFIIANNYILVPYFTAFGVVIPTLDIPPDMWTLLTTGLGGYVVGRSLEKATKNFKG